MLKRFLASLEMFYGFELFKISQKFQVSKKSDSSDFKLNAYPLMSTTDLKRTGK